MRIVFMGTPEFALPSLRILLEHAHDIPAVVTAPDKPRGRGQQVSFTPIKSFAQAHDLTVLQPDQLNDPGFRGALRALDPDLLVVVAFRILPQEVYTIPRLGSFNLHASLLPRYRGAAPINWAVINGERQTGVTTFLLQDRVDTGSVLLQRSTPIGPDETAGEVHDRLAAIGAEAVLETVRMLEQGTAAPRVQDESLASRAPKIFRDDCRIDWTSSAARVHNVVRGLSPAPCAWTTHRDRVMKLYRTRMTAEPLKGSMLPGTVVARSDEEILVATGNGAVALLELQQEGKRRLGVAEFLRGYHLEAGDHLV